MSAGEWAGPCPLKFDLNKGPELTAVNEWLAPASVTKCEEWKASHAPRGYIRVWCATQSVACTRAYEQLHRECPNSYDAAYNNFLLLSEEGEVLCLRYES